MLAELETLYSQVAQWANDNQGVVSISIFTITIAFGWISGIFSALRRKPKFKISLIDGPTFCCTYPSGKQYKEYETHQTGIALYLSVINVGTSPSSITNISVGYHWNLKPISVNWLRYTIGWFWITRQAVALTDFQAMIGDNIKVFPFLTQRNFLSPTISTTYLEIGRSTNGVVYFEQPDSWGGFFPSVKNGKVKIKVCLNDAFGKRHSAIFSIPSVSIDKAREYNPAFGKTFAELHGEQLPFDKQNTENTNKSE